LAQAIELLRQARSDSDGILYLRGQPLTAEALRGEIAAAIARLGGTAAHTIAAPGAQGADPHLVGTGPIRRNEPIVIDIFPRIDATGYFGDLTRTVVKGQAPAIVRRAYDAVAAAQTAALSMVAAGVEASEVNAAAATALETAGFATDCAADPPYGFIHGLGHGLGLEIHEGPRVNSRAELPLEVGNVITIEPGLYYPEWGGVRLEDVVVVRENDCENLTAAPRILELP